VSAPQQKDKLRHTHHPTARKILMPPVGADPCVCPTTEREIPPYTSSYCEKISMPPVGADPCVCPTTEREIPPYTSSYCEKNFDAPGRGRPVCLPLHQDAKGLMITLSLAGVKGYLINN